MCSEMWSKFTENQTNTHQCDGRQREVRQSEPREFPLKIQSWQMNFCVGGHLPKVKQKCENITLAGVKRPVVAFQLSPFDLWILGEAPRVHITLLWSILSFMCAWNVQHARLPAWHEWWIMVAKSEWHMGSAAVSVRSLYLPELCRVALQLHITHCSVC